MKVFFTGAGPGDPELLTVKARKLLEQARVCIWAGSLINPQILSLLPPECEIHDSAPLNLAEIIGLIEGAARRGLDVIRLHTGEPALYGAIAEQMRELRARGIAYEIVPGISAFQAAAAALQRELTAPEVAQAVVITRSSGRTPLPAGQELSAFARTGATLCIYLSAHKLSEVCAELTQHYGPDCPAALVYKASWPQERIFESTLSALPGQVAAGGGELERTAIILVGRALAGGAASKLYDAAFSHGSRP